MSWSETTETRSEAADHLLFQLNEIENEISHNKAMRGIVMDSLLDHLARYQVGDKLSRIRGSFGRDEIAEVIGMRPVWDENSRTYDVEYEIRKVNKDGSLHSMINKVKDSRLGNSSYEWSKYEESPNPIAVAPAGNEYASEGHAKQEQVQE